MYGEEGCTRALQDLADGDYVIDLRPLAEHPQLVSWVCGRRWRVDRLKIRTQKRAQAHLTMSQPRTVLPSGGLAARSLVSALAIVCSRLMADNRQSNRLLLLHRNREEEHEGPSNEPGSKLNGV